MFDLDDFIENIITTIKYTLPYILLIFLSGWLAVFMEQKECDEQAKALGYYCEYGIWTGCVLTNEKGKKILLKQLRNFEE